MFDTHCHLNFKPLAKNLDQVIKDAQKARVKYIVVPGTDIDSSKKALEIAKKFENVYAAVGIHPHHVKFKDQTCPTARRGSKIKTLINIEKIVQNEKIVAVGEVGLDRHLYTKTKYESYAVDELLIALQKEMLASQIQLAIKYKKSLILHNREAVDELLSLLTKYWHSNLSYRTVFHCCEANDKLLNFAKEKGIYVGVDGDVTFRKAKQEFVKKIPLNLLVLETDAPFLLPEPLRTEKKEFNEPKNLPIVAKFIADLKKVTLETLVKKTTANAKKLFSLENILVQ